MLSLKGRESVLNADAKDITKLALGCFRNRSDPFVQVT